MENFTLEQIREQLLKIENSNLDYYKQNVAIIVSDKNKFNEAVNEIANNQRNEVYEQWEEFASEMNGYSIAEDCVLNLGEDCESYYDGRYFGKTSINGWSKDFARILFEKQCWVYNFIVFQQETIYTTTFALNN
jgi:hypothetical protein